MKLYYLIIVLLITSVASFAQTDTSNNKQKNYWNISGNYAYGKILPTNPFVEGENFQGKPMEHYQAFTLKTLWQNPGYKDWQKIYKGPYYGIGITVGDFYNREEVGYPISYYGIFGIPIKRWEKLELYSEFQFGLTSNWIKYDSITNPYNIVIGGGLTVHVNIGINAYYPITKHIDLGAGLSFVHFSNGGFERPNRGFNIYAASIELKYHLDTRPDVRAITSPGRLERSNDLYFSLGYGDHQLVEHELDTNYYAVGGVSTIYFTQLSNAFRLGYGADLNYWWGLNALADGTPGPYSLDNFSLGFILQPELIIDRLTIVTGIGIYAIHLKYGNFKQTYQRLGVRYEFYKNLSFGVNVRAINFMLAEFLEFNLGYRIRSMK
jgi:opacity protein-like surface antigen